MKSGVLPIKKSHSDYSLSKTFGSLTPPQFTPCNYDLGITNPSQDALGFPYGCTGMTQTELCIDEDKILYDDYGYTYHNTQAIEGIFPQNAWYNAVGCDIRDSLKSTIIYGVKSKIELDGISHRRGAYYAIELVPGLDWFDSFRSALQVNKRPISFATPWYSSFTNSSGIIQSPASYDTRFATMHNHKICGWKNINGIDYLIDKPWLGPEFGDNGFFYFPRDVVNSLMQISGSGAYALAPFAGDNIQNVTLTIYQTLIIYLRMWLVSIKR